MRTLKGFGKRSAKGGNPLRGSKDAFIGSLGETAARAIVTATVTFAAGLVLKKLFDRSIKTAANEAVKDEVKSRPSKPAISPPSYRAPEKRLPSAG